MKLLNTGIADLLVVPDVPEGANQVKVNENCLYYETIPAIENSVICLPSGYKYTVLGRAAELTDSDWAKIVMCANVNSELRYHNYEFQELFFSTPSLSGHSLLKANGILLVNPYGPDEPKDIPDLGAFTQARREKWKMWKEAQSKITNPLILKAEKMQ